MTIPPFPSQDLAKLVLGYLAEEQLMTAYDEFLQASPYLDAFGNEYDRIFMTSLKNILAEYRAVKIYVETCKPFMLRKKILQCTNLLEMVKFLIQHVDITKIQECNSKSSIEKLTNKSNSCDVCYSLKLEKCACKSKVDSLPSTLSNTQCSISSVENSVETTSLSDLPGNHVTCRKKNTRVCKETSEVNVPVDDDVSSKLNRIKETINRSISSCSSSSKITHFDASQNTNVSENVHMLATKKDEEFKNILKKDADKLEPAREPENNINKQRVSVSGYNEFASGVLKGKGPNITVPDSSTSENFQVQIPATKENNMECKPVLKQTKTQYLLKVSNIKNNVPINQTEIINFKSKSKTNVPKTKSKSDESKIKILSDVKVDNSFSNPETLCANKMKKPPILKNATSTPLLQLQTIVINGTPVYKHRQYENQNYTKDEIMAMPTIILAPAPDPKRTGSNSEDSGLTVPTSSSARPLGPLIIDVASSNTYKSTNFVTQNFKEQKLCSIKENEEITEVQESVIAKTIDLTSASAPKDTTVLNTETSTPQVFPPLRKSSSTPRRTSHVRVLDFTTPRRILQEPLNKFASTDNETEVIVSKSPNLSIAINDESIVEGNDFPSNSQCASGSLKENSVQNNIRSRKINWDADLRALAIVSETNVSSLTPRSKPKTTKKFKDLHKAENEISSKKKTTPKPRVCKKKRITVPDEELEVLTVSDENVEVPIKPTINIISGIDKNPNSSSEVNKSLNKSNNAEKNDTPEMERMSLQNEIGSKLNISDLLETPFKQALYDIQMETPRFLGPDIPDDPMSDIKIMNIPTPRFLNTVATPSSYSSRPTDYSSGGSYYKPDDQDYMRVHDDLDCIVTSTKAALSNESNVKQEEDLKEVENVKPARPVRECTKNVSYYNIANLSNKVKSTESKTDMDSSVDSTGDVTNEKPNLSNPVTPKIRDHKVKANTIRKSSSKKRKTPIKKEMAKSFMKIRPRKPTPTKKNGKSKKRITDPTNHSKVQTRKKAANKESIVNATPVVESAPAKSRRKSSTPRKLHCTKTFHSESSGHESPDNKPKHQEKVLGLGQQNVLDSDNEHLPLRWSDDGSQEPQAVMINIPNDTDDIKQIKEYIETSVETIKIKEGRKEVHLHVDLVKRGFDLETAKIIERDLLDTPPHTRLEVEQQNLPVSTTIITEDQVRRDCKHAGSDHLLNQEASNKTLEESDCSVSNNLQIVQNEDEDVYEEIELSVHECDEDAPNYLTLVHDETKSTIEGESIKLKETFSMEVCIDDGVSIRLRATPFCLMHDQDPQTVEYLNYSYRETELAVSSISNFQKLYTPLKESIKAQCYEIFDSTLTSLDTPLKVDGSKINESDMNLTEIVQDKTEENVEPKKRKRVQSGNMSDDSVPDTKKTKQDAQLLFNSTNIQNIDIESVLSKLHGP